MKKLSIFLRDTRGVAIVDYAAVATLVTLVCQVAMRHGLELSDILRSVIPA